MDRWGRKVAHALIILPGIIGWTCIYYASSVATLLIGRIFCGLTAGGTVGLGAIVIGECSSPKHRGMFLNLKTASVYLGSTMVHIIGNYASWRAIALISLIPQIIALINIMTWYETPSFLVSKKEFEKAEKSFVWLRGKDVNSIKELNELIKAQTNVICKQNNTTPLKDIGDFFKIFKRKDFVKPIIIILCGGLLLEASGRHYFPAYALDIVAEVTGDKSQSFYYTLAIDLIITLSATFSSFLMNVMKRRKLLFTTGLASIITLAIVCPYLFLASRDIISNRSWIPIALFVMFFVLVNLGCTPIPLSFLGEVLPLAHRGVGSAIAGVMLSLCLYFGVHVTPFLLASVKVYGTFAVFGGVMTVLLLVLYFLVPETKDRTLQEIEDYFNYGRFRDDERVTEADEESKVQMLSKN